MLAASTISHEDEVMGGSVRPVLPEQQRQSSGHNDALHHSSSSVDSIIDSSQKAAASTTTASVENISSVPSHVNMIISEGMTAEEAAATRMNRLYSTTTTTTTEHDEINKVGSNNNHHNDVNTIAMTITEGMTAEEAQKARMARLQSSPISSFVPVSSSFDGSSATTTTTTTSTTTTINNKNGESSSSTTTSPLHQSNNAIPPTNNRGVSGLRQVASKRIKEPLSQTSSSSSSYNNNDDDNYASTILMTDDTSVASYNEGSTWDGTTTYYNNNDIQNDELLSFTTSTTATTTKFLGVPMTNNNPNTPLIATTTGLVTSWASYEVIDEYAYQFNTAHNGFIVDSMDRKQALVEQWDELVGTYFLPVEDVVVNAAGGGGEGGVPPVEFSAAVVVEPSADVVTPPEEAMAAASTPDIVTMDQGSVISTPAEVSTDAVAAPDAVAAAPLEQLSDASVGTIESPETATVTPTVPLQASTTAESTTAAPSLNEMPAMDEVVAASTPASSVESSGNTNVLPDAAVTSAPVEATQSAQATTESAGAAAAAAPSLNVGTVEEVATNAPIPSFDIGSDTVDLFTDNTAATAAVEPTQYSDVAAAAAGASTITAAPSLNDATLVDVGTPVDSTQYADAVSTVESNTVAASINDVKVEGVVTNAPVTSYEAENHAHSNLHGVEAITNANQGGMDAPVLSHGSGNTGLLADATTSVPVEAAQYSETSSAPSMNGVTMNQDAGNTPATSTSFENGNTDLLADATTSAPATPPTQLADVSGADTANAMPSLSDITSIDQNVLNGPAPSYDGGNTDLFAESTHQQRWFTAPPGTDHYRHTDYTSTVDQSGYSSGGGGYSFEGGSNGGSSVPESYSSWHSQGGSNPLRDLAASLPPPEDRARGTGGGDYYPETLTSQWPATQYDGFHTVADTPPLSGVDGLADSVSSSQYTNPPISYEEFEAPVSSISSDSLDSFATQSPDLSYEYIFRGADKIDSDSLSEVAPSVDTSVNDALVSAKANLFGSVSHSLGDIQGKVNAGVSSIKGLGHGDHFPFDTHTFEGALQNAGNTFQSIHPPAAVSSAIQHASDASLADIGNGIMDAVKFMASIVLTVVDANLDLAAPGSSSASVLKSVQSSVNSMLDNASYTVANVINDVGNLSLKDIVHNLMVLIVATADVIMKVMNAVVYLLSGKDAGNWALQASSTVNEATSQLLAQADDVTHQSIGNLASSIGDYSYHVGNDLVALLGSLNGVEGAQFDSTLDMVTTAMQTGFTM
eukprot:scaffold6447_cov144-Skeletonema_menzelii.AAC.3